MSDRRAFRRQALRVLRRGGCTCHPLITILDGPAAPPGVRRRSSTTRRAARSGRGSWRGTGSAGSRR